MKKYRKKIVSLFLIFCFALYNPSAAVALDNAFAKDIFAKAYILTEASTGRVIESKNEHKMLPIASTTKIMTALIALEQEKLDEYFTADSSAIKVEGSSMGLREGDSVSFFALANGMLLNSGNDAANAAAVKISGSISKFAALMNKRAAQLKMENTNFVNPSGLHDEAHYSTCYDMALLARAAIKNEKFLSICSKKKAQVMFGAPPYKRYLTNHNRLLGEYEGCIGIKTGFTKKAGRCLVSAAKRDGVTLICVTLDASNDWRDHTNLLNYGFNKVKPIEITPKYQDLEFDVVGGNLKHIGVIPNGKTYGCVTADTELEQEIFAEKFYYAPIKKGDILGEIRHKYNGETVAVTDLVADMTITYKEPKPKKGFIIKIRDFLKSLKLIR